MLFDLYARTPQNAFILGNCNDRSDGRYPHHEKIEPPGTSRDDTSFDYDRSGYNDGKENSYRLISVLHGTFSL